MRKTISVFMVLLFLLSLAGCSSKTYDIRITVPAGKTEGFVYSDEEISPKGKTIKILAGEGLCDTEIVLKTIEVNEEKTYQPAYISPGMPIKMEVEKGAWFKIGVSMQNPSQTDMNVYVTVSNIEVRIE